MTDRSRDLQVCAWADRDWNRNDRRIGDSGCKGGGEQEMKINHYITKYKENEKRFAEAWIQIDIFGKCFCLWRKRIEI